MKVFTELYKPKTSKEVYGQDFALLKLKDFIINFKKQKKKAALVYGPSGVGKTSSIYALANELDFEILELNASDYRSSSKIDSIIEPALNQKSLFFKEKIIIIDEIDGILNSEDKGGSQAISRLIENSNFPIIITANDPWDSKLSSIRNLSNMIEFKSLDYMTIARVLGKICNIQKITCTEEFLRKIAMKGNGDLRAAITDLQTISANKDSISENDILSVEDRNKKTSVFNALKTIFKTKNTKMVLYSIDNSDIDIDEAFLWLDENLHLEYSGNDLINAYDALSRADVFRGRIRNRQYYRFLVYQNNLMTVGVSLAKNKISGNFTNYKRNTRILKYWLAKMKYQKRKDISLKLSKSVHLSSRRVVKEILPYLSIILKKDKNLGLAKQLNLDDEEVLYLNSK